MYVYIHPHPLLQQQEVCIHSLLQQRGMYSHSLGTQEICMKQIVFYFCQGRAIFVSNLMPKENVTTIQPQVRYYFTSAIVVNQIH